MTDIEPRRFQPEVIPGWTDGKVRTISSLSVIGFAWGPISRVLLTGEQ